MSHYNEYYDELKQDAIDKKYPRVEQRVCMMKAIDMHSICDDFIFWEVPKVTIDMGDGGCSLGDYFLFLQKLFEWYDLVLPCRQNKRIISKLEDSSLICYGVGGVHALRETENFYEMVQLFLHKIGGMSPHIKLIDYWKFDISLGVGTFKENPKDKNFIEGCNSISLLMLGSLFVDMYRYVFEYTTRQKPLELHMALTRIHNLIIEAVFLCQQRKKERDNRLVF